MSQQPPYPNQPPYEGGVPMVHRQPAGDPWPPSAPYDRNTAAWSGDPEWGTPVAQTPPQPRPAPDQTVQMPRPQFQQPAAGPQGQHRRDKDTFAASLRCTTCGDSILPELAGAAIKLLGGAASPWWKRFAIPIVISLVTGLNVAFGQITPDPEGTDSLLDDRPPVVFETETPEPKVKGGKIGPPPPPEDEDVPEE